ncbi:hypothetical protein EQM14_00975 [Caproiciproducens sp. NJN-50]|uniref:hypothetical protein n=1 Tax=Acutalibacteraceae TaxID=3082771 RepID=UPI000FFE0959|nr:MULTISPECIES: hypothetical protein [Acutalibacteraceae]QAT48464.1 hypothetical protein EQM14_00975 [Caproiciproducens sp. NJN-50]
MKRVNPLFPALLFLAAAVLFGGCSHGPDAGVLLREAESNADSIRSCDAGVGQELVFTADGAQHAVSSSNQITYAAEPFALKSVQQTRNDGADSTGETYTVTEDGKLWFYCRPNGTWQKTGAGNLDTSPAAQVDILRMLNSAEDQKYVRETTMDSRKVHKIELRLSGEILRPAVETIAAVTGMSDGSGTVVQTLLNSAPDLYGYCYIDAGTGQLVKIEADLTDAANQIFQKIDGSSVSVHVVKCELSGNISDIGSASSVVLPDGAKNAASVQAYG